MTKRKLLILCTILATGILSSCKKDTHLDAAGSSVPADALNVKMGKGGFVEKPQIMNGMLYFKDDDQFDNYIDYLDESITRKEANISGVSEDPDDILEGLESGMGFTSLRHVTNEAFAQLNEIGWSSPDQIPEKHFIYDISLKSILNSNADVRIGDKITHYVNKDYAVTINADSDEKLERLHSLPLSASLTDVQGIDPNGDAFAIRYLTANSLLTAAQRGTATTVVMSTPSFSATQICSNPLEMALNGLVVWEQAGNNWIARTGTFVINWGDGSSTTIGSPSTQNPVVNTVHQYPHVGSYTVTIHAQGVSPVTFLSFSTGGTFNITVPGGCNFNAQNVHTTDVHDNMNMNRFMRCTDWVSQWRNIRGRDKHEIGACTVSFHLESNKWRESRIDEVGAEYSSTDYAGDCIANWGDGGASYNGNTKSATASHTNPDKIGWYQVFCKHKFRVGSNVFTYNRTLTPCN